MLIKSGIKALTVDNRNTERRTDEPRAACYDRLRTCMEKMLRDYYAMHPDRLLDQRSLDKVDMMRQALLCILQELDHYSIGERKP